MRIGHKPLAAVLAPATAAALLLAMAGCGATRPVRYYALNPGPPPAAAPSNQPLPVSVAVGRITASRLYREDAIVYNTGGVELGTYADHRWAQVPTEALEIMLAQSLRSKGRLQSVGALGDGAKGDYILRGHLYSLEEVDSPSLAARFSLELELFQPNTGKVVWTGSYTHDQPVAQKTVAAVAEALHQEVLAGLAQLTASLNSYLASVSPR